MADKSIPRTVKVVARDVAEPEIIGPQEGAREDALSAVADKLHAGINLWRQGRETCREGMLQAAAALAEAKALLPSTQAFGKWCDDNFPKVGDNDRAALIHFGKNLDKARQVLAATERSSPQLIYANEWDEGRVTSVRKSARAAPSTAYKTPKISDANDVKAQLHEHLANNAGEWFTVDYLSDKIVKPRCAPGSVRTELKKLGDEVLTRKTGLVIEYSGACVSQALTVGKHESLEAENERLKRELTAANARIAELEIENAQLRARLGEAASDSSDVRLVRLH
jgi:hypothetical protein